MKAKSISYQGQSNTVYEMAKDYFFAAEVLDKTELLAPIITNMDFSCELMLKAIIIREKKSVDRINSHEIKTLFEMMNDKTKHFIKGTADIHDWDSFFDEVNRAFIDWRYLHEKTGFLIVSIYDMKRLFETLSNYYESTYLT